MKRFLYTLTVLFWGSFAWGQECVTPDGSKENISFIKSVVNKYSNSRVSSISSSETKWAGIKFHLGSTSLTNPSEINNRITRVLYDLNKIYLPSGIQFYKSGDIHILGSNTITLTNWEDVDFGNSQIPIEFIQLSNTTEFSLNAINLYIYDEIFTQGQSSNSQINGIAMFPNVAKGSNIAAFRTDKFDLGLETIAHELGHYFNLWHTHHNSSINEPGSCSDGDFIFDTPIDPFVSSNSNGNNQFFTVNTSGNFIGRSDVNTVCGDAYSNYSPMTNNIMSYYHQYNRKREVLTPLQYLVIGMAYHQRQTANYTIIGDGGNTNALTLNGIYQAGNLYLSWNIVDSNNGIIIEEANSEMGEFSPVAYVLPNISEYSLQLSKTEAESKYYRVRRVDSKIYSNSFHFQNNYTPGITVLTHGFSLTGSLDGDWKKNAQALRKRISVNYGLNRGATILVNNPQTGRWKYLEDSENGNGIFSPNNEEIIFLFDWAAASNRPLSGNETGYLEAAADVLYAMLTNPIIEFPNGGTVNIAGQTPAQLITQKNSHFIGHSRGTILLLQTLYRLRTNFPDFTLERLTLLDPHPAGTFGDVKRADISGSPENLPGVYGAAVTCSLMLCYGGMNSIYLTIPDNVLKAENYFRQGLFYEQPSEGNNISPFAGVPLISGNNSYQLNNEIMSSGSSNVGGAHSAVPVWYFKTVDLSDNLTNNQIPWFSDAIGNFMTGLSRYTVGYNNTTLPNIPIKATLSQYNQTYQARTGKSQLEKVFNGDFSYGNSSGWHLNNLGFEQPRIINGELSMHPTLAKWAAHNIMYFPANYSSISMDVKLQLGSYGGTTMPMLIIEYYNTNGQKFRQAVKSIPLSTVVFSRINFGLPEELKGKNGTFRLLFGDNGALNDYNSANLNIIVDNIELSNETMTVSPPVISASKTTIQGGQSVVLSATGCEGGTVHWTTGETGTAITVSPYETTGYASFCAMDGFYSTPSNAIAIVVNYTHNIANAEYFFDTDPGYGNGYNLPVSTSGNIHQTFNIGLSPHNLSQGIHTFNVRIKDNKNDWSLTHTRPFLVLGMGAGESSEITHVEYFYDSLKTDKSNLIVQSVSPDGFNSIALPLNINLSQGVHTVSFRAKDNTGKYSLFHTRPFLVLGIGAGSSNLITHVEHFFDTDPGLGSGTQVPYSADNNGNTVLNLNLGAMSAGVHTLYVRVKDNKGRWSLTHVRPFVIMPVIAGSNATIQKVEYFLDNNDPGRGLATNVPFTSGQDVTVNFDLNLTPLSVGEHVLSVRVQDSNGNWSAIRNISFTRPQNLCENNKVISIAITSGNQEAKAGQSITATNKVSGQGTRVSYGADAVTLLPGFEVGGGAVFTVNQEGCDN
jgi:hypothetical protein